jgi:hypothetical protein
MAAVTTVKGDLQSAGVHEATEKCVWAPTQSLTWLGVVIDLQSFSLSITEKRLCSAERSLLILLERHSASCRDRMKVVGKLISMSAVIGPKTQMHTRVLTSLVNEDVVWDALSFIREEEKEEIRYWLENLRTFSIRSLLPNDRIMMRISADASSSAVGAVLSAIPSPLVASRLLSPSEQGESSTLRELRGILFALESFAPFIRAQRVIIQCDNQGAVTVCAKGSPRPALNRVAIDIESICDDLHCDLFPTWVPRELNQEADAASRLEDPDNWGISPKVFEFCQQRWGLFTIDRFADHLNTKCNRFNSKYFVPGTEGVNSFGQNWASEFNWVVPPVALIPQALLFMLANGSEGVLGIPDWPGARFYPLLVDNSGRWKPFVSDFVRFPVGTLMFCPCDNAPTSAFRSPFSAFPFLVLKISPISPSAIKTVPSH